MKNRLEKTGKELELYTTKGLLIEQLVKNSNADIAQSMRGDMRTTYRQII